MKTIERSSIDRFDLSRSFLFYAAGTGSLLVIDLVIGQYLDGDELAAWAFARSAIFLGASFVLLGLDQALLRIRIEPPVAFAKTLLARALLVGLFVFGLSLLGTSVLVSACVYLGSISLALLYSLGGYYRSRFDMTRSQIVLQVWKVLAVPLLLTAGITLGSGEQTAIALCLLLLVSSCVALLHASKTASLTPAVENLQEELDRLCRLGLRYWYSGLVSASTRFADQILLNIVATTSASAELFLYSTIFLPLPAFVSGFAANSYNPYLRQMGDGLRERWKHLVAISLAVLVIANLSSLLLGAALAGALNRFGQDWRWELIWLMTAIGVLAMAYVVPSGIVGVFGRRKHLDALAASGAGSLGAMAAAFIGLVTIGVEPALSMAIGLAINAFSRLAGASAIAISVSRTSRPLTVDPGDMR